MKFIHINKDASILSGIKSSDDRIIVGNAITQDNCLFFDFHSRGLYISDELITLTLINASAIEFIHMGVMKTKTLNLRRGLRFRSSVVSLPEETLKNFITKLARIAKQSR